MISEKMKSNLQIALDPIDEYKREMMKMLPLYYPTLRDNELEEVLDFAIAKRFKDASCSLYNNYKEQTMDTTLYKLTKYIESKKPIVTAFGVLFMRHGTMDNPLYEFIEELANVRVMYKDKMFECMEKGDIEGEKKYNLLQLLAKVDMNSFWIDQQGCESLCAYL